MHLVDPGRWEQGSDYHWTAAAEQTAPLGGGWDRPAVLTGSGRDALGLLLGFGKQEYGWRTLYVPSYFCQEVLLALVPVGLAITPYPDDPRQPLSPPTIGRAETLLVVNTFGIRERWSGGPSCPGIVIEDHTHDPWSEWAERSNADYCIASLRKTLPIPDGGVLWSPKDHTLPGCPALTSRHSEAVAQKLEAMLLKDFYLRGFDVSKDAFRALAVAGEAGMGGPQPSGMSRVSVARLGVLDLPRWRRLRRRNFEILADGLAGMHGISVLRPRAGGSCAFSVVVVFEDPGRREAVRRYLIEHRVYPAVLWPMDCAAFSVPDETLRLSERILSLHCDGRYDEDQLRETIAAFQRGLLN